MRYSRAIKESVLKKVLPPTSRSVKEVSKEFGINEQTIRNWIQKIENGTMDLGSDELGPNYLSSGEKFQLLLEGSALSDEQRSEWAREKGLHSQHLELWEQELRDVVTDRSQQKHNELKAAKKRIKDLEKALNRKDKALAEMAAILALKKKLDTVFGDQEDD